MTNSTWFANLLAFVICWKLQKKKKIASFKYRFEVQRGKMINYFKIKSKIEETKTNLCRS